MASLKDVYELIQSLEKRERIQFNMYANALSGKAKESYINDYQCFIKQKEYNKDGLKIALNKIKKRKNLSESNTNLYHCILDSLQGTYKNKLKKIGLLSEIQDIEILFQKGLIDQSSQYYYKLKNKFKDYENDGLQLYLNEFENQLLLHESKSHNNYDKRIELIDEQLTLVKGIELKLQFRKLKRQLFSLAGSVGTPRDQEGLEKYQQLMKSEALSIDTSLLPQSSYADYYIVKFMLQSCVEPKLHKKSIQILKDGLLLVEKEIDIKNHFVPAFLLTRMYMQTSVTSNFEKEALNSIAKFEKIIPFLKTNQHQVLSNTAIHAAYLSYYLNFEKTKDGYLYLSENKDNIIDKDNLKLSPHGYPSYISCARICLLEGYYTESLEYVALLLAMKGKIRNSIMPAVYCLYLLNHYKLENNEYLPYAIRNLYKSILKAGQLYEPEKALLSFFRKSVKLIDIKPEMKKLYDKLNNLRDDPFHASFFGNADYLSWLENVIN